MSHPHEAQGQQRASSVRFRPDIQGMRALAVLIVLAYHAGFDVYPGGFIGLDVFFVISGFLITHLLAAEIRRTGTLSLGDFYRRRARRILPAATVTAVATVVAAWLWLSLIAAEEAAYDAVWAAVFAANIRFAVEQTDYFALDEAPSPFQHYWSLSVEEQFYVGLPLLLLGCIAWAVRAAAKSGRPRRPLRVAFVAIAAVTAVSLAWSIHATSVSPETAYFSTFTRVWEFGVGGLLALAAPRLAGTLPAAARNGLAVSGLAAIVASCFLISPMDGFPGHLALLPALGTGAVMLAGAELGDRPAPAAQRLLGIAPMRLIGDASYSIYLWHWPVLTVATQHLGRDLSPRGTVFAIAIIFAISWASYRWVETPLRRGWPHRLRDTLVLYPVTVTAVAICSVAITTSTHLEAESGGDAITTEEFRFTPEGRKLDEDPTIARVEASARAAAEDAAVPGGLSPGLLDLEDDLADVGECDYRSQPWELCRRGDPEAEDTIVVLGNSHGRHWIPAVEEIAKRTGHRAYYLVKPQCPAVRADILRPGTTEVWEECEEFNAWAEEQVAELQPELVLISTTSGSRMLVDGEPTSDLDRTTPEVRQGFGDLIHSMQSHADRVVVLGDVPHRPSAPGDCLARRDATLGDCAGPPVTRPARFTDASRDAARRTGADYVDTWRWFCADQVCPAVIGSTVAYRDRNHITTVYAEELAEPLRKALGLPPAV